ncbi:MAG: HPr family phosphocarrier protein [Planctomyces sp.]|nr:HPr family phosphocarrier protein [Planctomyces sp.]
MNNSLVFRREIEVLLKDGLHMSPLSQINRLACAFSGPVSIARDEFIADAKSMLDLLQLNAVKGTMLVVEASGEQAQELVEGVARLMSGAPADGGPPGPSQHAD